MDPHSDLRRTILLVDDEPTNLQVLRHTLQNAYRLLFAKDGETALELAASAQPDLILLDIMMPGISGYDVCEQLKQNAQTRRIPVIFVTALSESTDEYRGLTLGAVDYITKPFNPPIVEARVKTQLSLVLAQEVFETRLQIVQCLGKAAEYRDNETGQHVVRVSHFARHLAREAGYSEEAADELLHAAPMHDVGKIGIPDSILLKPGQLNPAEWAIMQQHTVIGARIIGKHETGLLHTAALIARHHHERWDGSGYPDGLAGEAIPHQARIVTLVDVFDALTSVRPYKTAWSIEDSLHHLREGRGTHFDPDLVDLFMASVPAILDIRARFADTDDAHHERAKTPDALRLSGLHRSTTP